MGIEENKEKRCYNDEKSEEKKGLEDRKNSV
jgi:hypothetical protein